MAEVKPIQPAQCLNAMPQIFMSENKIPPALLPCSAEDDLTVTRGDMHSFRGPAWPLVYLTRARCEQLSFFQPKEPHTASQKGPSLLSPHLMSLFRQNAVAVLSSLARTRSVASLAVLPPRYLASSFSRTVATKVLLKPRLAQQPYSQLSDDALLNHQESSFSQQSTDPSQTDLAQSVFVGNIPFGTSEESLNQHFSGCGEIQSIHMHRNRRNGRFSGSATIVFATTDAAQAAIALHDVALDGRPLLVEQSNPRSRGDRASQDSSAIRNPPSKILYVGNLSYEATMEDIMQHFAAYDPVEARLGVDNLGRSKGYAHIEFPTLEVAQQALEVLKDEEFLGRTPKLDYAAPRRVVGDETGYTPRNREGERQNYGQRRVDGYGTRDRYGTRNGGDRGRDERQGGGGFGMRGSRDDDY